MMAAKMGRPADENLPEVYHPVPQSDAVLPEVVPDSSPEAAQQRYFQETDKYPAYYDTTPKLPHEQQQMPPGYYSPGQPEFQKPRTGAEAEHSVSAISPNSSVPWQSFQQGADDQQTYVGSEPEKPEKRICGLRKRLFIIIAAIIGVVVVAAAVGGGVGGAMASKSKASDEGADDRGGSASAISNSTTLTVPTTTTHASSSTTASAATPSITDLNEQTDPNVFHAFAFQGWSAANYKGKNTTILYDEGYYDFDFKVKSYAWVPKTPSNCCITYCHNKTESAGYWCDPRSQNATTDPFPRLHIWCGRSNTKMRTKCS